MNIIRLKNPIIKIMHSSLINLPTPSSISSWWNFGSLLSLCLLTQLITGVLAAMHYTSDISTAFESVEHLMRDINYGWMIRIIHANGASMFFFCLYLHIMRGMYYHSFKLIHTWLIGVSLLLIIMATAFIGYVLPWGQMSFWGATVITNLISAIPYMGQSIVLWVWGGFAVANATLNRFLALHFLLPFIIAAMVLMHLLFLHESGSSNPLGIKSNIDKISFHPLHSWKDLIGLMIMTSTLMFLSLNYPFLLGDCENFIPANPMSTPIHIQPEWYFLFAYAILRSIPNKLGGVIALFMSISILYVIPFIINHRTPASNFFCINKSIMWLILINVILLTWIGAKPVEAPFILIGQMLTICYFMLFPLWSLTIRFTNSLLH